MAFNGLWLQCLNGLCLDVVKIFVEFQGVYKQFILVQTFISEADSTQCLVEDDICRGYASLTKRTRY